MAASLAAATLSAQEAGKDSLGILHFFDYLDAMRGNRLDGAAEPLTSSPGPAVIVADAARGIPHVAFDRVFSDLVRTARQLGVVVFSQRNAYTCGALGYFTERVAAEGLVCLAASNSSAHMAAGGSTAAVFGTNPLSFAAPRGEGQSPLVFDQASSQTALVGIREAARNGVPIPEGWAVDAAGVHTTDASAALMGALLPFGGYKGANVALMVEMLATMSGASWSLDAGFFDSGERSPAVGMFLIGVDPSKFDPGYSARVAEHLARLRKDYGMRFPGDSHVAMPEGICSIAPKVFAKLQGLATPKGDPARI